LLRLFRNYWPDFIFFQPDLLSAHLDQLRQELAFDTNIQKLASVHGLSTAAQKTYIYIQPTLSQRKGTLARGSHLIGRSELANIEPSGANQELLTMFEDLTRSLQVIDYLPPLYQRRRDRISKKLSEWPNKFRTAWSKDLNWKTNEAYKRKERPPRTVPIPKHVIDEFLKSDEYTFLKEMYGDLDSQIAVANEVVAAESSRIGILDNPSFATYASLLHSATTCFPAIQFAQTGTFEWSPREILGKNRNLLVTAAPGFGKTSFCRHHFLADLESFREGSYILPLYFAAHAVSIDGQTFSQVFVRQEVEEKLAAEPTIEVRVYLDGIDEIRSTQLRDDILQLFKGACTADEARFRCVVTAREHVGDYASSWLTRVSISPMTPDKVRELVTAWLDGNPELIEGFYAELSRSESLVPVLSVPLLATLTVLVFKNLRRLPENKLRLYQMFIDLLLGGWNLAKGLQRKSTYSSTIKSLILTRLAGMMHGQKKKECEEVEMAATLAQVASSLVPQVQGVMSEFVEDGLLLPTGRASYTFPHLSFQEYLAAKDAIDPAREEERRIVTAYLAGDDWYKEVASFLVSMTSNPVRMRKWIVDLAKDFSGYGSLSAGEKRASFLIGKLSDIFPECKPNRS
jgi:hypothetical protein